MEFNSTILSNVEMSPNYWRIRLTAPAPFAAATPGQFVMVRVGGSIDPLLRRPLAVYDVGSTTATDGTTTVHFEMLYKVVGKGTTLLSRLHGGDSVNILGPLGQGFVLGDDDEEKLLVGGGIGLAPLYLAARELVKRKSPVRLFAGGRSRNDLLCLEEFERLGVDCHTATEDGSHGATGFVTVALNRHLDALAGKKATLYACGPDPMLRAVAKIAADRALPCQVSLEAAMACGVGACLGCVTPGKNHSAQTPDYRCVCAEGPVFESSELKWGA
ncbi:dihydroorotate dehydrogenase electron transfer subunit [uncultured Propionivibrio sp.]|uniref:dihydroorotate dehydrogenase electron transfer subunit n=1 Tax=uncultured Propionivibrio sp. TaxID=426737 RepID=UPI0029C071EC|nr:dihydroorotate dehydrogenase electron transfer subunit [uncultured Propionivibrio sp.]